MGKKGREGGSSFGTKRGAGTLGTFSGVFTQSVLTILGIILFRRLGYVVGSAGLAKALLIIGIANVISILTSISLSAIATNFRVRGGGDYYLISRTLGVEFGGAIGAVLFLAQSVSIAFYCIGFGEAVAWILPFEAVFLPRIIAAGAVAILFVFAWLGADWATRFQFVVMAFLGAALISFFAGGIAGFRSETLVLNWSGTGGGPSFWVIFAIFFPAATGFTQGVSMSGDLKSPGRSLPLGTFWAVGLSFLIYVAAAVLLAGGLPREGLAENYSIMGSLARWGWLVDAGVIAATLSSGMASYLGAPRILQALSKDRIFPFLRPFAAGTGATDNPRRGVLLSTGIAFATTALGNLNVIAPVVSMFFLISYGLLNYATFFEARAASPAFRPRFHWFDQRLSLAGALGCLGVMLALSPTAGALAVLFLFAVYQYLKRKAGPARWADGSRAHQFQRIRENLFGLASGIGHPRDWRPQILALSKDDNQREQLLRFAGWIEGGSGLTTAVEIVEGEREDRRAKRKAVEERLGAMIADRDFRAFPLVVTAPDMQTGVDLLIQAYGVGPLRANIILLNWLEQKAGEENLQGERKYGRYLREGLRLKRHLVVLDAESDEWDALVAGPGAEDRRIDVWWWWDSESHLSLLLAYLMTRSAGWEHAAIRIVTPRRKKKPGDIEPEMTALLEEARVKAEVVIADDETAEAMTACSAGASVVFLPMRLRGNQPVDPFGGFLEPLLTALPVVGLVMAGERVRLGVGPDEGEKSEIVDAAVAAADAEKAAVHAEKEAEHARDRVERAGEKLRTLEESAAEDEGKRQAAAAALQEAQTDANRTKRKAERARAHAEKFAVDRSPPPPPSSIEKE